MKAEQTQVIIRIKITYLNPKPSDLIINRLKVDE